MKPRKLLRWAALASWGSMVTACGGGVATLGSGDEPGGAGGTASTSTGGSGGEMLPGKGGTTSTAGRTGGAGMGAAPGERCMVDADCPERDVQCDPCVGGGSACTRTYCSSGRCVEAREQCLLECAVDRDCPVRDVACRQCGDGSEACETARCESGLCKNLPGVCPGDDRCAGLPCGASCQACGPDGMNCTDAATYCDAQGACNVGVPECIVPGECRNVMDCGTPPPVCEMCAGGMCASFDCVEGKCVFGCPTEPEPELECETVRDCPIMGDQCTPCPGTMKCAVQACLSNQCELVCLVE